MGFLKVEKKQKPASKNRKCIKKKIEEASEILDEIAKEWTKVIEEEDTKNVRTGQ